jgi:hypothetical protein
MLQSRETTLKENKTIYLLFMHICSDRMSPRTSLFDPIIIVQRDVNTLVRITHLATTHFTEHCKKCEYVTEYISDKHHRNCEVSTHKKRIIGKTKAFVFDDSYNCILCLDSLGVGIWIDDSEQHILSDST